MKIIFWCFLTVAMLCAVATQLHADPGGAISTSRPVRAGDVVGKVVVGYQGWFSCAGDGSPVNNWGHQNLEMWPDVREYVKTYQTKEPALGNGEPAKMFSSYDDQVVETHFKWMWESGIDCAALQRFGSETKPGSVLKAQRDGMALKVMHAAEKTGVKFYMMYDLSGWGVKGIEADWRETLVEKLKLLESSAYARQDGKPVVSIYGMGYAKWPASADEGLTLINFFKEQGCYVIGSVPGQWREGIGDSRPDFEKVYSSLNMLSAWGVGRRMDGNYAKWIEEDAAYCRAHGIDFQPCIYPGTSFYNSNGTTKNLIPREHGDFLWAQFVTLRKARVGQAYVAMFDEINEATSIFKCAEDVSMMPAGAGAKWYLALDAEGVHVSSDFYLREVKDGGAMLKGVRGLVEKCPTAYLLEAPKASPISQKKLNEHR